MYSVPPCSQAGGRESSVPPCSQAGLWGRTVCQLVPRPGGGNLATYSVPATLFPGQGEGAWGCTCASLFPGRGRKPGNILCACLFPGRGEGAWVHTVCLLVLRLGGGSLGTYSVPPHSQAFISQLQHKKWVEKL